MSEEAPERPNDSTRLKIGDATAFKWDGTRFTDKNLEMELYNFRNPGFLTQNDLRQLSASQDKFVQHLSARLSTFMRMECVLKIAKSGSTPFVKFTDAIQSPSHVTVFQVEPLRGIGILDMSLPIALAFADRLLGGKGVAPETPRSLTEIESTLVEDAIQIILSEWVHQWDDGETRYQPECIGHETSARFLQICEPDAPTLSTTLEVTFGDCMSQIQMGVPYSMIESVIKKMQRGPLRAGDGRSRKIEWRVPFDGISVAVTADWAVKQMLVRDVLEIREGDVIEMPRELIDRTRIRLSDTPEFIGTIGIENARVAVQLTKRIST